MLNPNLILEFRDQVNRYDFCYAYYSDFDGKNKWNCICSAMDWISVAIDEITFDPVQQGLGCNTSASLAAFMLIMRIAMIKEAIEQLHRAFLNTNKAYLDDDSSCFQNKIYPTTDNRYFQTIRACFGAHSVNLVPIGSNDKSTRRYSSWPHVSTGNLQVMLYSNNPDDDYLVLPLSFKELHDFALKRYNHLTDLICTIKQLRKEHPDLCNARYRE